MAKSLIIVHAGAKYTLEGIYYYYLMDMKNYINEEITKPLASCYAHIQFPKTDDVSSFFNR